MEVFKASRTIYIGNVEEGFLEKSIAERKLEGCGAIEKIEISAPPYNVLDLRGFLHVTFATWKEALAAVEKAGQVFGEECIVRLAFENRAPPSVDFGVAHILEEEESSVNGGVSGVLDGVLTRSRRMSGLEMPDDDEYYENELSQLSQSTPVPSSSRKKRRRRTTNTKIETHYSQKNRMEYSSSSFLQHEDLTQDDEATQETDFDSQRNDSMQNDIFTAEKSEWSQEQLNQNDDHTRRNRANSGIRQVYSWTESDTDTEDEEATQTDTERTQLSQLPRSSGKRRIVQSSLPDSSSSSSTSSPSSEDE